MNSDLELALVETPSAGFDPRCAHPNTPLDAGTRIYPGVRRVIGVGSARPVLPSVLPSSGATVDRVHELHLFCPKCWEREFGGSGQVGSTYSRL
jgi:hypothetical protein